MKKLLFLLTLLMLPVLALAQTNKWWEEVSVPATAMTAYGNATGSAGAWRIWPVATSGGGSFVAPLPSDVCSPQSINPKLYYAQNGTWANKTAVTFVFSYQILSASGHHQGSYSSTQTRNNTANMITNSTVQTVQFAQIPPTKVTPGGAIVGTVYRKGQVSTDTSGNTTIPIKMVFKVLRCRAD